jgi:hypothetical protein
MGYRGKLAERQQARLLRSSGLPLAFCCAWLRRFFEIDSRGAVPEAVPGGT